MVRASCTCLLYTSDLLDGLDEEKTAKFLTMLSDLGHASPIEHASFTFEMCIRDRYNISKLIFC